MSPFDPNVPLELKEVQQWFHEVITTPLEHLTSLKPRDEVKISYYIHPSPSLTPFERVQIYGQQYWWRLVSLLQKGYPLLSRILGYRAFNETIAIPWLATHPPDHWSLAKFGQGLSEWVKTSYEGEHKEMVYESAEVDGLFLQIFSAPEYPLLNLESLQEKHCLILQPFVRLHTSSFDLLPLRQKILKENPDRVAPLLNPGGPHFNVIFRTASYEFQYRSLEEGSYALLSLFKEGKTLDEAFHTLEKERPDLLKGFLPKLSESFALFSHLNLLTQCAVFR